MSSPPTESTQRPFLSRLAQTIFSSADDNNVMMAAIVSLVVVVLFVLVLHLYARSSFHSRSLRRHRRRRRSSNSDRQIPLIPISSFVLDLVARSGGASKGLEASAIAAIPLFVSGGEEAECVVCLSEFDGGEVGRRLPKCGHEFHVECIDMWLGSHSNCPICRAPAVAVVQDNSSPPSDLAEIVEIVDRGDLRDGDNGGDGFLVIEIDGNSNESSEINGSSESGCSSTSSFSSSLKRMLSRNRSERKVSPVNTAESTG